MTDPKLKQLAAALPEISFQKEVDLAPFTTVKIGGPAELLAVCENSSELEELTSIAYKLGLQPTVIGWGANSLISDAGIRGLVVVNKSNRIDLLDQVSQPLPKTAAPRFEANSLQSLPKSSEIKFYQRVKIDSGVALPVAINQLLAQGVTGLERFARIPGTIGGGVVNNIHGADHYLGDFVEKVEIINSAGEKEELQQEQLEFDYDYSIFHHQPAVILAAWLRLPQTNLALAKQLMVEWAKTKAHQPQRSLGCLFKNLKPEEQERLNISTSSAGYVIDKLLNLKNLRIGDAAVSQAHAAFVENLGQATSQDYLEVIKTIINTAKLRLKLELKPEIFFLGFTRQELSAIIPQ